jgi:hypothetical protein
MGPAMSELIEITNADDLDVATQKIYSAPAKHQRDEAWDGQEMVGGWLLCARSRGTDAATETTAHRRQNMAQATSKTETYIDRQELRSTILGRGQETEMAPLRKKLIKMTTLHMNRLISLS